MSWFSKKHKYQVAVPPKRSAKRKGKIIALYNFAEVQNDDGGNIRRPQRIELGGEESIQGGGLTLNTRFKAINLVRDLMRNSSLLKTDISMLQLNVIGNNADLMFYDHPEEWYRKAEALWRKWSKHASFRDGGSLVDLLDKILYTLVCEGDCVLLFDNDELDDSGKVLMFPPDQICPLADAEFQAQYGELGWTQTDGIFRDKFGRVVGVCISPKPGLQSVNGNEALILTRDDPYLPCNWIYVKRSFRDTIRGVADALPVLADLQDVNEILQYEKISAKRFAAQYAYVQEAPQESAVTPEGFLDAEELAGGEGDQDGTAEDDEKEYTIEHLQDVTAGMLDLLPNGSSVTFSPNDRPSPRTLEFVEAVREVAGGALGLTRSFALAKADTSYTAARWDTGVAAKSLAKMAQFIDDHVLDWLADRVINWSIEKELLEAAPDDEWLSAAAFTHPSGREVLDEAKEVSANANALKAGLTNLEALIGPNWRAVLSELATEKKFAEDLGLALSMAETKSGQVVDHTPDKIELNDMEPKNTAND